MAGGLFNYDDAYHDYHVCFLVSTNCPLQIDWKQDSLRFLIDANTVQTITAAYTVINGIQQVPNTPSWIQLSIWPAPVQRIQLNGVVACFPLFFSSVLMQG